MIYKVDLMFGFKKNLGMVCTFQQNIGKTRAEEIKLYVLYKIGLYLQ